MRISGPFPFRAIAVVPAVMAVMAVMLAGCTQAELPPAPLQSMTSTPPSSGTIPPETNGVSRGAGWHEVAIHGSVRSIADVNSESPPPHLVAAGLSGDQPLLVDVTAGSAREVIGDFPNRYRNGLFAVAADGANIAVTERTDSGLAKSATFWLGDDYSTYWRQVPRVAEGNRPGWLWPLMDGEEDLRSVGVIQSGNRWRLHAWQAFRHWVPLDRDPQLYVHEQPSSRTVLTGSTETTVVVAGALSDRPSRAGASPQVWTIADTLDVSHGRWQRHRMASTPDGLTDVADWDLGWWVAGHRNLRPVVYDFDSRNGATIPVPDTRLDPHHPVVFVAGIPVSRPMVLATQSVDGPTVWVRKGRSWIRIPAPTGKLSAARAVGDGVYLLIDGALWFRTLPDR